MSDPTPSRIFVSGRLQDRSAAESRRAVTEVDQSSHPDLFAAVQTVELIEPVTTATALDAAVALRADETG